MVINLRVKKGKIRYSKVRLNTVDIDMDNTSLLIIEGYNAFAMCGALNVDVYNSEKMIDRKVICMRAVGVRTIEALLDAKIESCSNYALEKGIKKDMLIRDAFEILSKK
jgi:uncharacterized protein YunC (DUF1805 family)